ncbi:MAG: hypothetical protein H6Q67_127 [Firmicutes bacterium]|nr:hypothetical protein [Bacillota bacterium]
MLHAIYDFAVPTLATMLCAFAVKLTDDYLDMDYDFACQQFNWSLYLGPGAIIYAILFLALAACIQTPLSSSLFLSSYAVGMFSDFDTKMPSGLKGWQETIVIIMAAVFLCGWQMTAFSLLITLAVQCLDDCIDMKTDVIGRRNLACRLGIVECVLIILLSLLAAYRLSFTLFFPVVTGLGLVVLFLLFRQGVRY